MTVLREVVAELVAMFVAEKRLTTAVLGIVIAPGCFAKLTDLNPLVGGAVILLGCQILLIESVWRSARAGLS